MTRKKPRHRAINVGTSEYQITDAADLLYSVSQSLRDGIAQCNLSSQFRTKLNRLNERLEHYAKHLAEALPSKEAEAFSTAEKTRAYLTNLSKATE